MLFPRRSARGVMLRCAAVLALPPLTAAAAPAAAPPPPFLLSEDWLATCDELLSCQLLGFARGDDQPVLVIDKPRTGTARGAVLLSPGPATPLSVRLLLPRRPDPVTAAPRPGTDAALFHRGALSTAETTAVLAVLRGGGRIRFVVPGPRTPRPFAVLHLSGAPAALDWIADRQRHLPDPPAVEPPPPFFDGPRPDPGRPPAAVLALPAAQRCSALADPDASQTGDLSAWRLDPGRTLWGVPCGSDNFTRSTLFVLDGPAGAAPVEFPNPLGSGDASPALPGVLDNAEVDPDGRRINATRPKRGLGDCGEARGFRWDGERFRLTSARVMPVCRGLSLPDWPVIYGSPG